MTTIYSYQCLGCGTIYQRSDRPRSHFWCTGEPINSFDDFFLEEIYPARYISAYQREFNAENMTAAKLKEIWDRAGKPIQEETSPPRRLQTVKSPDNFSIKQPLLVKKNLKSDNPESLKSLCCCTIL